MKESVLRAAAIAALALALVTSGLTWAAWARSAQRGGFILGFFEFALILFLGVVAWALFNSLADIVTVRTHVEVLNARLGKIEAALGIEPPEFTPATRRADTAGRPGKSGETVASGGAEDAAGAEATDDHREESA